MSSEKPESVEPEGSFLARWSRRKLQAEQKGGPEPVVAVETLQPPASIETTKAPLPDVASLTADSDFSRFMQPEVDETLKRGALKKLFADPQFNVMDGLDIYVGDYSKPDPIPQAMLRQLNQARGLLTFPEEAVSDESAMALPGTAAALPQAESNIDTAGLVKSSGDETAEGTPASPQTAQKV